MIPLFSTPKQIIDSFNILFKRLSVDASTFQRAPSRFRVATRSPGLDKIASTTYTKEKNRKSTPFGPARRRVFRRRLFVASAFTFFSLSFNFPFSRRFSGPIPLNFPNPPIRGFFDAIFRLFFFFAVDFSFGVVGVDAPLLRDGDKRLLQTRTFDATRRSSTRDPSRTSRAKR